MKAPFDLSAGVISELLGLKVFPFKNSSSSSYHLQRHFNFYSNKCKFNVVQCVSVNKSFSRNCIECKVLHAFGNCLVFVEQEFL